jgi:hypothetical protein
MRLCGYNDVKSHLGANLMAMQPVAVMPLHDPEGLVLPHLKTITPQLKRLFAQAFIRVTVSTRETQTAWVNWVESEDFYRVVYSQPDQAVGGQFRELYAYAVNRCHPEQILHLCFPDRVAFALENAHRKQFTADVQAVTDADVPLLFQRSDKAWDTHPQNYREVEGLATRVGELLLRQTLDLAWCHLAVQAQQMEEVLPQVRRPDLSMLAEVVLGLGERINTKKVDWLAWEDPFIQGREAGDLKREREGSVEETQKRLSYVIPVLQLLTESVEA